MKIVCVSLILALASAACPSDTVTMPLKDSSRKLTFTGFEPTVKRYVQMLCCMFVRLALIFAHLKYCLVYVYIPY